MDDLSDGFLKNGLFKSPKGPILHLRQIQPPEANKKQQKPKISAGGPAFKIPLVVGFMLF